jgi:hypothetical protein
MHDRAAKRYPPMSPLAFASFGANAVAYVRQMRSEEAEALYPQAPALIPGITVFVLHAADGTPLSICGSFEAAAHDADGHALETVYVH